MSAWVEAWQGTRGSQKITHCSICMLPVRVCSGPDAHLAVERSRDPTASLHYFRYLLGELTDDEIRTIGHRVEPRKSPWPNSKGKHEAFITFLRRDRPHLVHEFQQGPRYYIVLTVEGVRFTSHHNLWESQAYKIVGKLCEDMGLQAVVEYMEEDER